MNKFKFYFIVITASFLFFSCSKDNINNPIEPPRDYATQYNTEIIDIKDYLKNNYINVIDKPGFPEDQDVTITKLEIGDITHKSIWEQTKYKLLFRTVKMHNVDYTLYYLVLREGVGESPCNVDGVFTSYKGTYLSRTTATTTTPSEVTATFFEEDRYPQSIFSLYNVITGWSEIFPQFKSGTSKEHLLPNGKPDGTIDYSDFGAGVIFIPSGLGYYNTGSGSIPSYSPLVFSFKLYKIKRLDQDNDGVFSFQEDLNNDNYIYDYRNTNQYPTPPTTNHDDTDKDGIPDFIDVDDDGDNYTTRLETKRPNIIVNGVSVSNGYYPFDGAKDTNGDPSDDLTTPNINEGQGIPEYSANGTPDYTTSNRKRIHVDKEHHTAKP